MLALRIADVTMMKRAVRDLERLSREIPTLTRHLRHARGMYWLLRRDYAQAIALLEAMATNPSLALPACAAGWHKPTMRCIGTPRRKPSVSTRSRERKVALLERDFVGARAHLAALETFYRPTGISTLIDQISLLRREIEGGVAPDREARVDERRSDPATDAITKIQASRKIS